MGWVHTGVWCMPFQSTSRASARAGTISRSMSHFQRGFHRAIHSAASLQGPRVPHGQLPSRLEHSAPPPLRLRLRVSRSSGRGAACSLRARANLRPGDGARLLLRTQSTHRSRAHRAMNPQMPGVAGQAAWPGLQQRQELLSEVRPLAPPSSALVPPMARAVARARAALRKVGQA